MIKKIELICKQCKKTFWIESNRIPVEQGGIRKGIKKRKYCSRICQGKAFSKNVRGTKYIFKNGKRKRISKKDSKKYLFIGKKEIRRGGYIHIWNGKTWIPEHRNIMEIYLKRKLEKGEAVHHRNGDKTDNRIENLQLLTSYRHSPFVETKHSEDICFLLKQKKKLIKEIKDLSFETNYLNDLLDIKNKKDFYQSKLLYPIIEIEDK